MILHIDMDAFYAAVEIRDHPHWKGRPIVVGGSPKGRGVVAAASYAAREYGIRSAMPASQAIRLCSDVIFVRPRMKCYADAARKIRDIFFRFTSLVEPLSLDEAFLDVAGSRRLFGSAESIGRQIKALITEQLGLVASVGVAPNKFLAKLASDLEKPDGFVVVPPNEIAEFLDPLDVGRVWGIGTQTLKKFHSLGIHTIGHLHRLPKETLKTRFGAQGEAFWRMARGLDSRRVVPDREAKSISHETTFFQDIDNQEALVAWMFDLSDQVARRLRRQRVGGRTVQIKIRDSQFETLSRSKTLVEPTSSTRELAEVSVGLLREYLPNRKRGIRLLGMGVTNLSRDPSVQQMLFDQESQEKTKRVDNATDQILDRFGASAVQRATNLEHEIKSVSQHRSPPLEEMD